MKFLAIDKHVAVIPDVRHTLNKLGHTVNHICLSGHCDLVGIYRSSIDELNGDNWCNVLTQKKCDEFWDKYKSVLDKYDGFICGYPPSFSMLYAKSNKPIIIYIPIRYEHGFDNNKEGFIS